MFFLNPAKLSIGVSTPDLSATIGQFNRIIDRTIRTISEDGGGRSRMHQTEFLKEISEIMC